MYDKIHVLQLFTAKLVDIRFMYHVMLELSNTGVNLKIQKNIILENVYKVSLENCNKCCNNWVSNVKKIVKWLRFCIHFYENKFVDPKVFPNVFTSRVIDSFKQEWSGTLDRSPVLCNYKCCKSVFNYENYLDILQRKYRFYFCRLRISVHPLRMQTGTYVRNNIPRELRYCQCCNLLNLEEEYHFICVCPSYHYIRTKYLNNYHFVRPSMYKCIDLLNI